MNETYSWADHKVFEDPERGAILLGVDQSALFTLEPETRDVLARWRGCEPIRLGAVSGTDREVLETFRGAGLLLRRPLPDRGPRTDEEAPPIPLGTLVLEVAQACNLRCSYCYADGGAYGGPPRLLDPELARKAGRFLVEASGDRKRITLVLFGGEPTLNLPAVRGAVEEAEEAAQGAGKELVVSLTTNGTGITAELADFLREHRVNVSVSIDGPPDVHDAHRRYPDGGGTYADVLAGLDLLLRRTGRAPAARVTLTPERWDRVPEVFEHVRALGFLEVGIAPASPVTRELLPSPDQEEVLLAGFSLLTERFLREAEQGRPLPFSNVLDLLGRLHKGQVKGAPCGAGLGYVAMDASGRLFLCHRLAGEEAFAVGDLASGVDRERVRACLSSQARPRRAACSTCWARGLCAGGCHYENHLRESRLGLPPGGSCGFVKRWLELGIRAYARLCRDEENPVLAFLGRRADG